MVKLIKRENETFLHPKPIWYFIHFCGYFEISFFNALSINVCQIKKKRGESVKKRGDDKVERKIEKPE